MIKSLLQAIPFILQTAPSVKTRLEGKDYGRVNQAAGQMAEIAGQQRGLAEAQYDQSSPYFQQIYRQERNAGQQDLASTISEISRQNRKLMSMGRSPLLDRERGGESVFRNLMTAQQGIGDQARRNTFSQLSNAQSSLGRAQGAYGDIYNAYGGLADEEYANRQKKDSAYYTIGDVLKNLFNLDQQGKETIRWNK